MTAPHITQTGAALPRTAYTVAEVAKSTGLSRAYVYQLVETGQLPAVRIGRRVLITPAGLTEFLAAAQPAT